jgi:hypothetical protein
MGKGTSWKPNECEALCKAWLDVSQDAVTGSDQKGNQFYQRIAERMQQHLNVTRPVEVIKSQ